MHENHSKHATNSEHNKRPIDHIDYSIEIEAVSVMVKLTVFFLVYAYGMETMKIVKVLYEKH